MPEFDAVENNGCDEMEVEILLDILHKAIWQAASVRAVKLVFNVADFPNSREGLVDNFRLTIEKNANQNCSPWIAVFESGASKLIVHGKLGKISQRNG